MNLVLVAFTPRGALLAARLAKTLKARAFAPAKYCQYEALLPLTISVGQWARQWFSRSSALVFISACGIAVRAIAPLVGDKGSDPAVVVLDEQGRNVIPLLSGHLGGANRLAKHIASLTGGQVVLTTATDINNVPAVDVWARDHNCALENIDAVKDVSAAVLEGERVGVAITEKIVDPPFPITLWLRPQVLVLGVGCRRGVDTQVLLRTIDEFLARCGVSPLSLKAVATIDIKGNEPGLVASCRILGLPLITFSAEELRRTKGKFTPSERVLNITGVDNVCERAAVRASGGRLIRGKTLFPGITLALAKGEGYTLPRRDRKEGKG